MCVNDDSGLSKVKKKNEPDLEGGWSAVTKDVKRRALHYVVVRTQDRGHMVCEIESAEGGVLVYRQVSAAVYGRALAAQYALGHINERLGPPKAVKEAVAVVPGPIKAPEAPPDDGWTEIKPGKWVDDHGWMIYVTPGPGRLWYVCDGQGQARDYADTLAEAKALAEKLRLEEAAQAPRFRRDGIAGRYKDAAGWRIVRQPRGRWLLMDPSGKKVGDYKTLEEAIRNRP